MTTDSCYGQAPSRSLYRGVVQTVFPNRRFIYQDVFGYAFSGSGSHPIDWYYVASSIYNTRPDESIYLGNTTAAAVTVHIPIVDVGQDYIETTLGPSGTGLITLKWVGSGTSFTIVQENRAAGTHQDGFRLADLTNGSTFTSLQATWVVNGETGSDSKAYLFTVLGDYINTCYNTPAESDYAGGSFTAGTATSSCGWSSRSFLTAFLDSVNLNGSGVDSSSTALQIEGFCSNPPGSSPAYNGRRYRRPTDIKTSCNNSPAVDVTVASPSLACGTSVFIKTIGVRNGPGYWRRLGK